MNAQTTLIKQLRKETNIDIVMLADFVRFVLLLGATKEELEQMYEAINEIVKLRGLDDR